MASSGVAMPRLVRLYLFSIAIGFFLALIFSGLLVFADIGGLRHLILEHPSGWLAAGMLVFFHGILFSGVQFAIAVMRLAEPPDQGPGAHRRPSWFRTTAPAPVQLPRKG